MKQIGIFKSGTTVHDIVEHMPVGQKEIERIFPKGSSQTTLWISGYFTNLSPTFHIHVFFYNSRREVQEVLVEPFHQVDIENQNIERLVIMTTDHDSNSTFFGAWEYVFTGKVAETYEEAELLLVRTTLTQKSINPKDRFINRIFLQGDIDAGSDQSVSIDDNRQMLVLSFRIFVDIGQLSSNPPFNANWHIFTEFRRGADILRVSFADLDAIEGKIAYNDVNWSFFGIGSPATPATYVIDVAAFNVSPSTAGIRFELEYVII